MIESFIFTFIVLGSILVEPFKIAEAEPGHHQVCLRADMTPDGRFAVTWLDSTYTDNTEVFIRFFDKNGTPLTNPYKFPKLYDTTTRVHSPCLQMDTAGNAVLVVADGRIQGLVGEIKCLPEIRYLRFDRDGNPIEPVRTLREDAWLQGWRSLDFTLANNGDFVIAWSENQIIEKTCVRVQRFDIDGNPKCDPFYPHDADFGEERIKFFVPQVAVNDSNDLIVTWLDFTGEGDIYPMFQVFDAENEPILPWISKGHRADGTNDTCMKACRVKPIWVKDDRLALFWPISIPYRYDTDVFGRVFTDKGLTPHYMNDHILPDDSLENTLIDLRGQYSIDYIFDSDLPLINTGDFILSFTRTYSDPKDPDRKWDHQAALIGRVQYNNWIRRWDYPFQFTPEWGVDTVGLKSFGHQAPAVAVGLDRILWTYSRFNSDTIFEAWAMISDWDMPSGIEEEPIAISTSVELQSTLNHLSYEVPGEASLILYNAAGRRITEEVIHGKGEWQAVGIPSGVYFARVDSEGYSARAKVVVVR